MGYRAALLLRRRFGLRARVDSGNEGDKNRNNDEPMHDG